MGRRLFTALLILAMCIPFVGPAASVKAETTQTKLVHDYVATALAATRSPHIEGRNTGDDSGLSNEAFATTPSAVQSVVIKLVIDEKDYTVNGVSMKMDVAPVIMEGRTLGPVRYVAEALGADVAWDPVERKATVTLGSKVIELWVGGNTARVNGALMLIDRLNPEVKPIILPPGRTMLPFRFIAEHLGAEVGWDPVKREVTINRAEVKRTEQVVNLGGIFPMTGGSAAFGSSCQNGMLMAVEEFNKAGGAMVAGIKTTINYILEDDKASPAAGASAAQKLINQGKVIGIIGAVMSSVTLAVAPICQQAGVPEISPTSTNATITLVGDYIFRACFIDRFQGRVMASYAYNTLKLKTAAVLYDNGNDYNKGLAESFKVSFEALGGTIVAYEAYTDEAHTVDYKPQLTKIKTANPEFLYLPNYYGGVALQLRQAREMGLVVPAGGGDGWDSPDLVKIGGEAVEGGVFSNHFSKDDKTPAVQKFVTAYTVKYGTAPDAIAALTYDAAGLFLDAFKTAGSIKGSDIRDAMKNTTYLGIGGAYTFDENRDPIKAAVIIKIVNGQQTYLTTVNP